MRRALCALVLLCTALLVRPTIAWAHAHLKKSLPAAGSTTAAPLEAIRLWFSEKPELTFTKVTLADSAGTAVDLGPPAADGDDPLAVQVPVRGALAAGTYTVTWATAASDGHPSKGHFTFHVTVAAAAVAVAPPPAPGIPAVDTVRPAPKSTEDAAPSANTPAYIAARAISFAALLAMIGAVVFRTGVLIRTDGLDVPTKSMISKSVAFWATVAALVFVAAAFARLYLQNRMMSGVSSMGTDWGAAWRWQVIAGIIAFVAFAIARANEPVGWPLAGIAVILPAVATALAGHAAATPEMRTFAIADDAVHILAAAGWMGSLLWLGAAGLPIIKGTGDERAIRAAALVHAFSPVALACGATVALTGVISAKFRLGTWGAIWGNPYANVLLVKLALLVALAAMGFHNWRNVRPSLGTDDATTRLERSAAIELAIGALVVIVTAVLVATPTPL